jgi:MFS superfamily sulfate permease-like transporter
MDVVIVCVIIGIVLSAILSAVFGVYSKATATPYIRTLFGMSSIDLISGVTLAVIIAAFFLLAHTLHMVAGLRIRLRILYDCWVSTSLFFSLKNL